jgi:hypothetical protein
MPKRPRVKWLDRTMMAGPYLTLCLSEEEYRAALKSIRIPDDGEPWCPEHFDGAKCHQIRSSGALHCIVTMNGSGEHLPEEVAAMLAHEAVHVWQATCEFIGETNPGREQAAYAIQNIVYVLYQDYLSRGAK